MKGRKPGISRFRRAFLVAAAAIGITAGSAGLDQLPKDPVTDTHITFQTGTPDQYGYNISPLDQMWKHTLNMKSAAQLEADLFAAAQDGDSWRVRALVRHGMTPDATDQALKTGARAGHADVVEALLSRQASTPGLNAAMIEAARQGHTDIALMLIDYGASAHAYGSEALIHAARNGDARLVGSLLIGGADANVQSGAALQAALEARHADIADALLAAKKLVSVPVATYDPYSIWTGSEPYHHINRQMIQRGFGPPPFFSDSDFPVYFDVYERPFIDVNANNGQALYTAVYRNDAASVRVLLKHGANPDARGGEIKQLANESRNTEIVNLLSGKTASGPTPPRL